MTRFCLICGESFVPVRPEVRCCSYACAGASRTNRPEDLWEYVQTGAPDVCWPWTRWLDRDGYGSFTTGGRTYKAHRLAFKLSTGRDPGLLVVCHSCDTPACCNPAHLFLGTQADNLRDMCEKGRSRTGSRHHAAQITEAQAIDIRRRRTAGEKGRDIAAAFGLSEASVSDIYHGRTWRHVA